MGNELHTGRQIDLEYQLHDNLTRQSGRIFITGTQALVRMLVMQRKLDEQNGLNTAGFVSGYRGSPLAAVDMEMWKCKDALHANDITFVPAVNEDLAATMMMGTQQAGTDPNRKVDGVFGLWYGKGLGVDRSGDAMHHGNAAGASEHGGVLIIVGDDHAATSSSVPNATDLSLVGWHMPIVHPSSVEEYVEFGLWGWALSRYSSTWVAFKAISETVESGRSMSATGLPTFVKPEGFVSPVGALSYSTRDFLTLAVEERLAAKLDAVAAFAAANPIDKLVVKAPHAKLGIVTVGKAHHDVMEVLRRFGLDLAQLEQAGIRIYKPGLTFPLEKTGLLRFSNGLQHILVIEEKAAVVESQIKDLLYNEAERPTVIGKTGVGGGKLINWVGQLRPALLAPVIATWLREIAGMDLAAHVPCFTQLQTLSNEADGLRRLPYFCSGCPHNSSTKVPEGSKALGGVGCHYMATWMDRSTSGLTQMGGEGADWVGLAPFTSTPHVFQNMGEGTYFHSGYMAIRQAIAAGVNVTYKILFNDAVAMTGGQPVDGKISVPQISHQMQSEGAKKVVVLSDEPEKYGGIDLGAGVKVHHRRDLDVVQRELREIAGVTILIYDQTCAAEKRRRRKRNKPDKVVFPDPPRRLVINSAVCEGCGDCGIQSNCTSIVPLETEFGRKRAIEQSSCNKDYSCAEGFCPSFVSVVGGTLKKGAGNREAGKLLDEQIPKLPLPVTGSSSVPYNLLVCGVGGTGVITLGALITMAAHLEGKGAAVLDFTALAQKGGSVLSHVRIADHPDQIEQVRIDWQQADAVIACDLVVGVLPDSLGTMKFGHTHVLANEHVAPLAEFTRNPQADPRKDALLEKFRHAAGNERVELLNAQELAKNLLGDAIGANMLMLGYAWQKGWIPVSLAAMERAIELNGVSIAANKKAFAYGRVAAAAPTIISQFLRPTSAQVVHFTAPVSVEKTVATREAFLEKYQNQSYAKRYRDVVDAIHAKERAVFPDTKHAQFSAAVARNLFKLMAYKDEYEVARLYTDGEFAKTVQSQFDGSYSLQFHLAPPLLAKRKPGTDVPAKMTFGPYMLQAFKVLARLRGLRGSWLDPFGYTAERKMERRLIEEYAALVQKLAEQMTVDNYAKLVEIATYPDAIRGFGHIKHANAIRALKRRDQLLSEKDSMPKNVTRAVSHG